MENIRNNQKLLAFLITLGYMVLPVALIASNATGYLQYTPLGRLPSDAHPLKEALMSCAWVFLWFIPILAGVVVQVGRQGNGHR